MPRKGRELEKLVALLEKNFDSNEITITSPEHIKGKISSETREIDVTLRGKIASTDVLIIFECRDRKKTQGLAWIEELASKGKDVGANKIIAVSSKGFSHGAKKIAKSSGIELRTIENIDVHEISSWFNCQHITCFNRNFEIIQANFILADKRNNIKLTPDEILKFKKSVNLHEQLFLKKIDGTKASLIDVWSCASQDEIFGDIPIEGPKITKLVHLEFSNETDRFQLDISSPVDISRFDLLVNLWIKIIEQPVSNVRAYKTDSKTLSEIVEFDFKSLGKEMNLIFQRDPGTEQTFLHIKEKEKQKKK